MYMTPNKLKKAGKKTVTDNPQAADEKTEKLRRKKEELPESSP